MLTFLMYLMYLVLCSQTDLDHPSLNFQLLFSMLWTFECDIRQDQPYSDELQNFLSIPSRHMKGKQPRGRAFLLPLKHYV